jgi:spore maturation protein CgeB
VVEGGYDLRVWGLWWDDQTKPYHLPSRYTGGYLGHLDLPTVYSSADIVLGLHLDASSPTQTSIRTFEALGCGAFYLTEYTPAHERLFVNGEHLVWSKSAEETADLVAFYLPRPEARERIATAGLAEAYAKHTVTHRALEVREALRRHLGIV